jgi:GTP-binding protein EngB required for normal cell division
MLAALIRPLRQQLHANVVKSYRLYSTGGTNVLNDVFKRCLACGSPFHEGKDVNSPGSVASAIRKGHAETTKNKENRRFDKMFGSLDDDKKEFLKKEAMEFGKKNDPDLQEMPESWTTETTEAISKSKSQKKMEHKERDRKHVCARCISMANDQNKQIEIVQPVKDYDSMMNEMIPADSTIVNVIDAVDFPTTVDKNLKSKKARNKVLWVVNKADLLVTQKYKASERALPYVQKELAKIVNARPEDVLLVSANLGWGLDRLRDALGSDNYFVGYANTGKSTLALKLAQRFVGEVPVTNIPQRRIGCSKFPWQTQRPFTYELEGAKIINDLPSYPEEGNGTHGLLKYKMLNKLVVGKVLLKDPGNYNVTRVVASHPRHVISLGGLLVIERDHNHLISWPIAGDVATKTKKFSSLEKVVELASVTEDQMPLYKQLDRFFYHKPEYANVGYTTYNFKLFPEGLTIAVRGVGIIHLQSFGRIPHDGINVTAHALNGVKIATRGNILPYLRDTPETTRKASKLADSEIKYTRELKRSKGK